MDDAPGTGACLRVRLPRSLSLPAAGGDPPAIAKTKNWLEGRRILVVDDEKDIAMVVQAILRARICESVYAGSGAEAIDALGREGSTSW